MSFLKKALLTAAVAAVGLAGTAVAPTPASAATAGTAALQAGMYLAPLSGGAYIDNSVCVDSTGLGICQINGSGEFTGRCGVGSGYISGSMYTSNGQVSSFHIGFTVAGTFQASGSFYNHSTGEQGPIAISGVATEPVNLGTIDPCPVEFFLTGSVTFGAV